MASSISDQGFFTTGGVLKTDSSKPSTADSSTQTNDSSGLAAADTNDTAVKEQANEATASAISEAAVVKISKELNVGSSGFDNGVADIVKKAVSQGLSNQAAGNTESAASQKKPVGGTYQNEIINGVKSKSSKSPTEDSKGSAPESGDAKPSPTSPPPPRSGDVNDRQRRRAQDDHGARDGESKNRFNREDRDFNIGGNRRVRAYSDNSQPVKNGKSSRSEV